MPEAIADVAVDPIPEVIPAAPAARPAPAPVPRPAGQPAPAKEPPHARPAMERAKQALRDRARSEDTPQPPTKPTPGERSARPGRNPPAEQPKPGEPPPQPAGQEPKAGEQEPKPGAQEPKAGEETPKPSAEDLETAQKKGPWAVANNYKKAFKAEQARAADLERRLAETGDVKGLQEKAQTLEARNKELEEEIKYHNYAKSKEFNENFERPYKAAWDAAVRELGELPVVLPDGSTRPGNGEDLYTLINANKAEARLKAKELFGEEFAQDALDVRKTVRELAEKRQNALDAAKQTASSRMDQLQETAKHNVQLFQEAVKSDAAKYDWLKPIEGDQEWNARLSQATKFVTDAYSANSNDPRLTPEQRSDIVKKHVAVFNRAIGFTPMRMRALRAEAKIATLEKELAKFKESEPGPGSGKGEGAPAGGTMSRMEAAKAEIRRRSRPDPAGY